MTNAGERGCTEIMSDILILTRAMVEKLNNAEFLVESINKRELLMEEYDRSKAKIPAADFDRIRPEIGKMIGEISKLNDKIGEALAVLKSEAKKELQDSTTQSQVLKYTNKAISSSGSYMDVKDV